MVNAIKGLFISCQEPPWGLPGTSARWIRKAHTHALVVSTETITPNYYVGSERAMLLPNCLSRIGGGATALLSNSSTNKARFCLKHVVRTLTGAQDNAYTCVFEQEDDDGNVGINLDKDLMTIAGSTLKANSITAMHGTPCAPGIGAAPVGALLHRAQGAQRQVQAVHIPDFRTAFEHFCIHAGSRAVVDELHRR